MTTLRKHYTARDLARLIRTVRSLKLLQIAWRPIHHASRLVALGTPAGRGPALRSAWSPPPPGLTAFLVREARRASARCDRIPPESLLRAYEEQYAFELFGPGEKNLRPVTRAGLEAGPCSVRARNIALACRLGASGLETELARACRSVVLQLEFHLLGNHLLENGIALVCGGAVAKGTEADLWWRIGRAIVSDQLEAQFLPDGGHFEGSASYHLWLVAGLIESVFLCEAAGRPVPAGWKTTIRRALEWARAVRAPDGSFPLFNDASLDASPGIDELLSLAETAGVNAPQAGTPGSSRDGPWVRVLGNTGWVIARTIDGAWLVLDAGPDGAPYQPGHVHADALTFELWIGGERVCVDYGVSSYRLGRERDETRSTRSHNTVEVDGENSSEVWGAFRVGRRCRSKVIRAERQGDAIVIEGQHDGYRWRSGRPVHRRVVLLQAGRLEIADRIDGFFGRATSRILLDQQAARRVQVRAVPNATCRDGSWYAEFGSARAASRMECEVPRAGSCRWVITW